MKKTISILSLLWAVGTMASTPQGHIMQPDNFPSPQGREAHVNIRQRLVSTDAPVMKETERATHPVKIKITRGKLGRGIEIFYINETGFYMLDDEEGFVYDETSGICTADLPEGMLDLIVVVHNMYVNNEVGYFVKRGVSYYFIDDVNVGADTPQLTADANECTLLPLSFVMADGQPLEFATKHWNGTEMGPETGGNCIYGGASFTFYNSKYNVEGPHYLGSGIPTYYTGLGLDAADDNPMTYLIPTCNKASDRWSFIIKLNTMTEDMEWGYIVASINPSSSGVSVGKDDYRKVGWNFPETGFKGIEYNFGVGYNDSGNIMESGSMAETSKPLDVSAAVVNGAKGVDRLSLMTQAKCALDIDYTDPDWPEYFGILSPMSNISPSAQYFHPASYMFTAKPWTDDTKYRQYLPEYTWGSEYSNYSGADLAMKFGGSTPFLTTSVWRNEDHDSGATTGFQLNTYVIDLAGTLRTDWDKLQSEVYFNGRLVKDKDTSLEDFESSWDVAAEGLGKMKYVLTDTPDFEIDGMQPVNVTEISYDQSLPTWEPPTVTSLLFKNSDGKVTNRIETGKDAVMEMYAGGVKWLQYWYFHPYAERYFSNATQIITDDVTPRIEYAPYGSDNWQSIETSENEAERNEAYGNHYLVNLGGVTAASGNGWYDLRITLTTPEGNSQIQTLSPAFHIADMAGVETVTFGSDNAEIRYFDLSGRQISNPASGQTVIKVDSNGATKVRF